LSVSYHKTSTKAKIGDHLVQMSDTQEVKLTITVHKASVISCNLR